MNERSQAIRKFQRILYEGLFDMTNDDKIIYISNESEATVLAHNLAIECADYLLNNGYFRGLHRKVRR